MRHCILRLSCPDQSGIIATLANTCQTLGLNIIATDEHATSDAGGTFYIRIAFASGSITPKEKIESEIAKAVEHLNADWSLDDADRKLSMGILMSKTGHCLADLLHRHSVGELAIDIPFITGNHDDGQALAKHYGIPFHLINAKDKSQAEAEILALAEETDALILARYMQILSHDFIDNYGHDIINIHHSFLPAFIGQNPYQQAYERGVKLIGATAHFVTADLDEGPIISQDVTHCSHRDTVETLRRKGHNLEKVVLSQAINAYSEHRILRCANKTVIFE